MLGQGQKMLGPSGGTCKKPLNGEKNRPGPGEGATPPQRALSEVVSEVQTTKKEETMNLATGNRKWQTEYGNLGGKRRQRVESQKKTKRRITRTPYAKCGQKKRRDNASSRP